ncbi:MAG: glycosyltransferase family 2 protein [Bacteroidota bacterium]
MKLSVIIVNYNVKYFLEQALLAVRNAAQHIDCEVLVVDNASSDDSVEMVRNQFPEVQLIANKANVGFSKANNQAIRIAKGEYVLLLNPDTVVQENSFTAPVQYLDDHPDAGALGVHMIDGQGQFLPESKRGFPTPFVAFCKTFGLSRLFPNSPRFNRYHLGYLDERKNHEVDILSGAYMLMRKSVLEEVGLLDETFFMYGEDIDLSYRIQKGGYKNVYFADTTIIHYKGESTKKGSLNYVKVFYNAMIIFARKHFQGERARLFVLMLQAAIWFRAALTIFQNIFRRALRPMIDALVIFFGMWWLKTFWAVTIFKDPAYFLPRFMAFNVPLYILLWISSLFFSGSYDQPYSLGRLVRGLFPGTVIVAAVYGLLPAELRSSRALLLLGGAWAFLAIWGLRLLEHFWRFGNFRMSGRAIENLIIVGSEEESERVQRLIYKAGVSRNLIGTVSPEANKQNNFLGPLDQLDRIVETYDAHELIFCSQEVPASQVIHWMSTLGAKYDYKILPERSLSIIGSNSKNTSGDIYTIDIEYQISQSMNRRNKRVFDLGLCFLLLLFLPLHWWFLQRKLTFFGRWFQVLIAQKSWVGYHPKDEKRPQLPKIKPGVLNPTHAIRHEIDDQSTIHRLNFLYAKDYQTEQDLTIFRKGFRQI